MKDYRKILRNFMLGDFAKDVEFIEDSKKTTRTPLSVFKFRKIDGEPIPELQDGVVLPPEEGWFSPTVNPFLHVCCDCKLAHKVEFCLTDKEGNQIPFPEGALLALRFMRDEEETSHLRKNGMGLGKGYDIPCKK